MNGLAGMIETESVIVRCRDIALVAPDKFTLYPVDCPVIEIRKAAVPYMWSTCHGSPPSVRDVYHPPGLFMHHSYAAKEWQRSQAVRVVGLMS